MGSCDISGAEFSNGLWRLRSEPRSIRFASQRNGSPHADGELARPIMIRTRIWLWAVSPLVAGVCFVVAGCRIGPQYVRPAAPLAPAFKEPLPENFKSEDGDRKST